MERQKRTRRRPWTAAAVLAVLIIGFAASPDARAEDNPPAEKRFGPLEKSLLVPGWGQLAERRYIEGFVFLGAEIACLYGVFRNNRLGNRSYDLYKAAVSVEDVVRHRRDVETFDGRRNKFLLAAAAVWAANLIDIALIAKHKSGGRRAVAFRIGRDAPREIRFSLVCGF